MRRFGLLLFLALVTLPGCRGPRFDTPVVAYTSFSDALRRGDYQTAYSALSQQTRSAIEAQSKELAAASGGSVRDEPIQLAFSTGVRATPPGEVKLLGQQGDTATIRVTAGDRTEDLHMVREGDRWAVDLSTAFKK